MFLICAIPCSSGIPGVARAEADGGVRELAQHRRGSDDDDDNDDDDDGLLLSLSKRTPMLNTHTFTPVESELNTLSAASAAPKLRLAGTDA
jgi:hypothetical protein